MAAACGGDDYSGSEGTATTEPTAVVTSAPGTTSFTAEQLLPDLSALGLARGDVNVTPFSQLDEAGVLYGEPVEGTAIKLIIYVLDDEGEGKAHFELLVEAFENMPVAALLADPLSAGNPGDLPPVNTKVVVGPEIADEAVHFRTKTADGSGKNVWTDVHRIGNVAVVVQVLARDKPVADERREATIAAIAAKLAGG